MDNTSKPYTRAVMGGTFDRLHDAHRRLLRTAVHMCEEVFVGVVGEELGKKLFPNKELNEMIQSYEVRAESVKQFLDKYDVYGEIGKLTDPWGPAPIDERADVIIVSYETVKNGHRINRMREENGLNKIDVLVIPWVWKNGVMISSTLKRKEEAGIDT